MRVVINEFAFACVGAPVTHCKTFQINVVHFLIILMDLVHQSGDINSAIALSCNVSRPLIELCESVEKFKESEEVDFGDKLIIPGGVF